MRALIIRYPGKSLKSAKAAELAWFTLRLPLGQSRLGEIRQFGSAPCGYHLLQETHKILSDYLRLRVMLAQLVQHDFQRLGIEGFGLGIPPLGRVQHGQMIQTGVAWMAAPLFANAASPIFSPTFSNAFGTM